MQHVDGYPEDLTVATPRAVVRVDGKKVDVSSLSLDSEIGSAMPDQAAAAGGGIVASTGDMSIVSDEDSTTINDGGPWGAAFPPHDFTTIDLGYGDAMVRQFTGRVDGFNGSPLSISKQVKLIDEVDALDQRVSIEPLMSAMPTRQNGQSGYRLISLRPIYITDSVLRECGFYATPQAQGECVFSAPMMGSAWPEIGEVDVSRSITDPTERGPHHVDTHWGVGVRNGYIEWLPEVSGWSGRLNRTFQMIHTLGYRSNATASQRWTCWWGTHGIRVQVDSNRRVYVRLMNSETVVSSVSMSPSLIEDADVFTARVHTDGVVELMASNGHVEAGSFILPSDITSSNMSRVELVASDGAIPIGGLQASFSTWNAHSIQRNAHLSGQAFTNNIWATPAYSSVTAKSILKEQAEANVDAMWIDENGHFRWENRHRLETSEPVGSLTSEAHILDIPWEYPVKSEFSEVEVTSLYPIRSYTRNTTLTVWQGSNQSMDAGDESTVIIKIPADEEWFDVATPLRYPAAPLNDVRRGRGSLMSGVITRGDEEDYVTGSQLYQQFRRIGRDAFAIESRANPPEGWTVEQRFLNTAYGRFNEDNLPILRARAKVSWEDRSYIGAHRGTARRPILKHDAGPWVQIEEEVQALADWLSEHVTHAAPILRDVPIVPDPRIQKGDVYWLEDSDAYRVRLRVLVMGISTSFDAGPPAQLSQTITCRIISHERVGATLAEHDQVWEDTTLAAQDSYWSGSTLAEHDADPLRRG